MRSVSIEFILIIAVLTITSAMLTGLVTDRLINMEARIEQQLDRIEATTKKLPTSTDAHGYYEEMMNEIDKIVR